MRILVTGATGFIGSFLVPELVNAGHHAVGLSRSDAGSEALLRAGAEVRRGDVNDLQGLRAAAEDADAIIHLAFNHAFSEVKQSSEQDREVIRTLGAAIGGSDRPLIISSGTGLVRSTTGRPAAETDGHARSDQFPRAASEEAADALISGGSRVIVVRLAQVHDTRGFGRITQHVRLARQRGRVAYVGRGENRLPAVHVSDAARLYRLALEHGRAGAHYHAVAEEGVPLRAIADVIGAGLRLPVESITEDQASAYFGPLAGLVTIDLAASSGLTRRELGWTSRGPDLLTDLRHAEWSAV